MKCAIMLALAEGKHVHVASNAGMRCAGGAPECPVERVSGPDYGLP
jgi:hypothetical protein